jgi:CRISPR-associated protein Cas2
MRSRYLVCYDIADERRLTKVFRYMKGRGVHLQYSVFLCSLTWTELQSLKADLEGYIERSKDDVRLYPLPSGEPIETLGGAALVPDGALVMLP